MGQTIGWPDFHHENFHYNEKGEEELEKDHFMDYDLDACLLYTSRYDHQ